jgi:choline kinase
MKTSLIILAAGIGSRLGKTYPKCLYELPTGESILARQIRFSKLCGIEQIIVVVGFKYSLIMEQFPQLLYCYNPYYHITNTSKSLLAAIKLIKDRDVVWINGDVVFDVEILENVIKMPGNVLAVDQKKCGEEEIKYKCLNERVVELSKSVKEPQGESLGIQKVSLKNIERFVCDLKQCDDNDYFERAIQLNIDSGENWSTYDIGYSKAIEVDFDDDWSQAKKEFNK